MTRRKLEEDVHSIHGHRHNRCTGSPGGCQAGKAKAPKVDVSIEANLYAAHEVGDLIIYRIDVTNDTAGPLTVTDELTGLNESVGAHQSATFQQNCHLSTTPGADCYVEAIPAPGEDAAALANTATAINGTGTVEGSESVSTNISGFDACDPDGDGMFRRPDGYSVCIWQPSSPGDWTLDVTARGKTPTTIRMNLRDHVPGNWCPFTPESVRIGKNDPPEATFEVTVPETPTNWHGEGICPRGGAGGDPIGVGTTGSFYLATYGAYDVAATPTTTP